MSARDRLRIAIQKSGRLSDASQDLLARCGLTFRRSRDKLFCFGESLPVDLLLVRDDDVPGMIADGVCDLGIVGRNVLAEQALGAGPEPAFRELRALGFGQCRLSLAVPQESTWEGPAGIASQRIATTYPNLLADWLRRHEVEAKIVTLSGSVEIAPRLGTADVICDLVSSGATLAANQLREVATVLESEAVLAGGAALPNDERAGLAQMLMRRIDGVIQVRVSKLVMLHAPRAALDAITRLLPQGQPPTIMPIEGSVDDIALQAVCTDAITWQHLEDMKRAGARQMLVLPVEQMLA
ncbi:ATP phosphoribosyltransferase [Dokdonella sp. MW10]|uniref:ATP phosphoribosyltransferase n=1 Tax=Dokdonella sp. MW10 TaxID=2992926 RepID=UPI003F7FA2DF